MKSKIIKIISECTEVNVSDIDEKTLLYDVMDSLEFIKVLVLVEKEFEIEFNFDDMDYDKLSTVLSIATYITENKK